MAWSLLQWAVMEDTLGSRLRAARTAAALTRHATAVAVEVSPDTIGRWERDDTAPDVGELRRLAGVYGVSVSALMGEAPLRAVGR